MENKFGLKDLFIIALLTVLIVLSGLTIWQYNRQWEQLTVLRKQTDALATDLSGIRRQSQEISSGVTRELLDLSEQNAAVSASLAELNNRLSAGIQLAPGEAGEGASERASTQPAVTALKWESGRGRNGATDPFYLIAEAEQQPDFARGGMLRNNFGTKVGRLTPLVSGDAYQAIIENLTLESLVGRDVHTLEFMPRLAERWSISEDGLTATFRLRRGVVFSDGHPFTADDVIFTFDWIKNPEVDAARTRSYLEKLERWTKVDDFTVRFEFTEPYFANFESVAGMTILPRHFYSRFSPTEFNERVGLLMGTGPYMLDDPENWTPGNGVTLRRNPRYWGTPPTFDVLSYKEIQEDAASMVMYGNQEFDILGCTPEMYRKMTQDQRVMAFSTAVEYTSSFSGYSYIGWNQARREGGKSTPTRFADKKLRQALTMLIDRERIAREIYLGYAEPAAGPFSPGSGQADPSIQAWQYDLARAKAMLAELGYKDANNDGVLEDPQGQPFRFKLTYPTGSDTGEKVVRFLVDSFKAGGIIMEPEPLQWPVLVDRLNAGNFDAITLGWSASLESDPYQIFHSAQIKDNGDNRTSYANPELDRLIEQARITVDRDERMLLWQQVHAILHEDLPYTFMMRTKALRLFNNRLQNVEESAVGLNYESLNGPPIPWYVPLNQQVPTP